MSDMRFPIGPFSPEPDYSPEKRSQFIDEIERLPARLRAAVEKFDDAQLDTPYRPDGWTIRQVVHHVPDSHMNSYVRFKLALTEENPTIRPYDEAAWANLDDSRAPIASSLDILEALHERWTRLLRSMSDADFARTLVHPESGAMRLDRMLHLYAWHGAHHLAHVTAVRDREGW